MAVTGTDQVKVTKNCAGCGKPMHLWQDSSGSGWAHDRLTDEYACWNVNRDAYEDGDL
jgi:hypothetical protein